MQVESVVRSTPEHARMSTQDAQPVSEEAVRAHTYSLLGTLFAAAPDEALLHTLSAIEVADTADAQFAESWRLLAMAAGRAEATAVAGEYQDLFIGLGRGQVMPYGSWYMTGFLMDRPLAVLRADLAKLGIERNADVHEPEDHVAALCETMAMLCAQGADLDQQRHFFAAHLEPWLVAFMKDVQDASSARFYKAVGCLGERFIEFESRYMAMLL